MSGPARVAVFGGGIGGLASAYYLLRRGLQPTVFEAADCLGGLGSSFTYDDIEIDRFYHVILDSDADLVALIQDVGLAGDLLWRDTGMGFHLGGRLYPFNTPGDLLRFRALSLADRLRVAAGALYITRVKQRALDLDDVPADRWLRMVFGARVFERIWAPLLRAKFGAHADRVPAYWVWNTLTREKNGRPERKGYVRGGYRRLAQRLGETIALGGGDVRLNTSVAHVAVVPAGIAVTAGGTCETFAAAISTVPLPLLARLAHTSLRAQIPLPSLRYQGVVNAVVISRVPLERFYWTVVVDDDFPFDGVVETTHVVPPQWVGHRHLIYLMNYCAAESDLYRRSDETVAEQALASLPRCYPRFAPAMVEAIRVFRAPYVEPMWPVGYLRQRPAARVAATPLYLSTTAQAYPRVTAWNTSVALARETVDALVADRDHRGAESSERVAA